eukprot:2587301-Prymnesium_polylepis.1
MVPAGAREHDHELAVGVGRRQRFAKLRDSVDARDAAAKVVHWPPHDGDVQQAIRDAPTAARAQPDREPRHHAAPHRLRRRVGLLDDGIL